MNPRALVSLLVAAMATTAMAAEPAPTGVTLEVLADTTAVVPGKSFQLGVRIIHQPGFHTYWMAPGIVGMASSVEWQLPAGFSAGPLHWPAPENVKMLRYAAYGYESPAMLVATITPPAALAPGQPLRFTAHATWMACATTCHPGTSLLTVELPVAATAAPANAAAFAAAARRVPQNLTLPGIQAATDAKNLTLTFTLPPGSDPAGIVFIPETNLYDPNTAQQLSSDPAGRCVLTIPLMPLAAAQVPPTLSGLLHRPGGWPQLEGAKFGRISVKLERAP